MLVCMISVSNEMSEPAIIIVVLKVIHLRYNDFRLPNTSAVCIVNINIINSDHKNRFLHTLHAPSMAKNSPAT